MRLGVLLEVEVVYRGIGVEFRKVEEVLGVVDVMMGFENGEGLVRYLQVEEMCGVDVRDVCVDDEDVVVFDIVGRYVGELFVVGCFVG